MVERIRNFEPALPWSNEDRRLSERAQGWTRAVTQALTPTPTTVSAAISGTAGATYTSAEQDLINDLITQVTELRAILIANGQAA